MDQLSLCCSIFFLKMDQNNVKSYAIKYLLRKTSSKKWFESTTDSPPRMIAFKCKTLKTEIFPGKRNLVMGMVRFCTTSLSMSEKTIYFYELIISNHCLSLFMTCRMSLKDLVGSITRRRGITLTLTPFSMGERKQKMESSL